MNVSLYQAAAAMNASSRWQELIAENLAGAQVPGARQEEVSFHAVEAGLAPSATGAAAAHYMIPTAMSAMNFQPGELRPTRVSTDFALEGSGVFEVQMPNGTHAYTRDGEFHVNAQGQLLTKQGYKVLGEGGPLQLDPNNSAPITVSPHGDVSQGDRTVGKMRIVEFKSPDRLTALSQDYFLANPAATGPAQTSANTSVRQGYLESANAKSANQMANMISALRMFESNEKVLQMQDERMGSVISQLGSPS